MITKVHKLDNPAWYALNETHAGFSIEYPGVKFYIPEYCAFGGATNKVLAVEGISEHAALVDSFYIIGEQPLLPDAVRLEKELVCNQMLLEKPMDVDLQETIVALNTEAQRQDLFNLVNLVQPGYFKNKTAALGQYFGIYKANKLVAVSGERMKMNDFTEISAIVTHPEFTRNGYARQLVKYTTDEVFRENKIPYLHVVESNSPAIQLYEKSGFTTRRKISFWKLGLV